MAVSPERSSMASSTAVTRAAERPPSPQTKTSGPLGPLVSFPPYTSKCGWSLNFNQSPGTPPGQMHPHIGRLHQPRKLAQQEPRPRHFPIGQQKCCKLPQKVGQLKVEKGVIFSPSILFHEKEPIQRSANYRYPSTATKRANRGAHRARAQYQRGHVLHLENHAINEVLRKK